MSISRRFPAWKFYGIGAAVCAAISIALWLSLVAPTVQAREQQSLLRRQVTERSRRTMLLTAELGADLRQITFTQKALSRDTVRLEAPAGLNRRMARLGEMAVARGLTIDQIIPGAPVDGACFATVPIRLSGRGSSRQGAALLHELHESCPDLALQGFEMTAAPALKPGTVAFRYDFLWCTQK